MIKFKLFLMKHFCVDFVSNTPSKEHLSFWEFALIPQVNAAGDDQGYAIGIGWLFWTFVIYLPKWE